MLHRILGALTERRTNRYRVALQARRGLESTRPNGTVRVAILGLNLT